MHDQIRVHKGRTVILPVSLGYDVSQDEFVSEIRSEKDPESDLLATWDVTFATDGTDGELVLQLDDSATAAVDKRIGYMDIKRISSGEPFNVFDEVLEVRFIQSVTT